MWKSESVQVARFPVQTILPHRSFFPLPFDSLLSPRNCIDCYYRYEDTPRPHEKETSASPGIHLKVKVHQLSAGRERQGFGKFESQNITKYI